MSVIQSYNWDNHLVVDVTYSQWEDETYINCLLDIVEEWIDSVPAFEQEHLVHDVRSSDALVVAFINQAFDNCGCLPKYDITIDVRSVK